MIEIANRSDLQYYPPQQTLTPHSWPWPWTVCDLRHSKEKQYKQPFPFPGLGGTWNCTVAVCISSPSRRAWVGLAKENSGRDGAAESQGELGYFRGKIGRPGGRQERSMALPALVERNEILGPQDLRWSWVQPGLFVVKQWLKRKHLELSRERMMRAVINIWVSSLELGCWLRWES